MRGQRCHLRVGVEQVHDFLRLTLAAEHSNRNRFDSEHSFARFAGRVVSYPVETALILYLTTPVLLKYNTTKRDKITLG